MVPIQELELFKELCQKIAKNACEDNLHLVYSNLGDDQIEQLAEAIARNSNVTKLSLGMNKFGLKGAIALAKALKVNRKLEILIINGNKIGKEGACSILEVLKHNRTLKLLSLAGIDLRNAVKEIAEFLSTNNCLTTLYIGDTNLGLEGGRTVLRALHRNRSLTTLDLWGNQFGSDIGPDIALLLKNNPVIASLGLICNNFTLKTIQSVLEGLKHNRSLATLKLPAEILGPEQDRPAIEAVLSEIRNLIALNHPENRKKERNAERLALAMGLHSRLGEHSPLRAISGNALFDKSLLQLVFQFAGSNEGNFHSESMDEGADDSIDDNTDEIVERPSKRARHR